MINSLQNKKILALIFTILITIEIFYFSSLSSVPGTQTGTRNWIPEIYHFTIFFLFSFFLFITIKGNKKIKPKYIFIVLTISIIQAFLDEAHQIFVPFRYPSFTDILTNSLGIFSAILIYLYIDKKLIKHTP